MSFLLRDTLIVSLAFLCVWNYCKIQEMYYFSIKSTSSFLEEKNLLHQHRKKAPGGNDWNFPGNSVPLKVSEQNFRQMLGEIKLAATAKTKKIP